MDEAEQDALLAAIEAGDASSPLLDPADRAILVYALKLTSTPQDMVADDVAALRAVGLDDRGIHDVCAIAAYFAFVNRVADGLGVELEGRFG